MSGGLLIGGHVVPVPGLTIRNPTDTPWCRLDAGDYRARRTPWVRQIIVHTTKGKWPQHVKPGAGAGGRDQWVAEFWRGDPEHSAAQLVVDNDGSIACLTDLAHTCAYHAGLSNDWSIGIEMYQELDGGVHEAVYAATIPLVVALCEQFSIPLQMPSRRYNNAPMGRMVSGGPDMIGVFGHRDNTSRRGRGDPGDEFFRRLELAGAEAFDYELRADLATWRRRQMYLVAMFSERLTVDGKPGPSTIAAMRRHGFASGRAIPA